MAPRLSAIIEEIGFGLAQIRIIILAGGVALADGAELYLLGAITAAVQEEWHLTPLERGFVVSIVFFGVLVGNACSGLFGDVYGRRGTIWFRI